MNTEPLTVQHAWADRCGCDRNDERVTEPHLYGWPEKFAIFRDGWDAAWLDCKPFLKDGETPAECIARNRADADLLLADLAKERLRAEKAEAALAALSSTTAPEELPLSCEVNDGAITILIGAKCLAHATNINPALWDAENDRGQFKVTDPVAFAKEVHRELVREEEDGSTPLTRTLDKAIYEAINQGAEGIEEASAVSATEASKP